MDNMDTMDGTDRMEDRDALEDLEDLEDTSGIGGIEATQETTQPGAEAPPRQRLPDHVPQAGGLPHPTRRLLSPAVSPGHAQPRSAPSRSRESPDAWHAPRQHTLASGMAGAARGDVPSRQQQSSASTASGSPGRSSADRAPVHPLSARDETILRAFAIYRYLSTDQVRRLCRYNQGSLDYVRKQLKQLVDAAFVLRVRLPRASAGNAPWIYALDRLGIAYMADATDSDLYAAGRFRASAQYERSYFFLSHTLAVNDFLIAASLLEHEVPSLRLAELRHEHTLKRTPVRVALGPAEKQTVILDGWLDFHLHGKLRLCVGLERDRATEAEGAFIRKLRGLLAFAAGPYQVAFGVDSLTVAIATTAGPRRVEQMRAWCERVLRAEGRMEDADLFFLASLPEGELDPKTVFLAPIWSRPFTTDQAPLLEPILEAQP